MAAAPLALASVLAAAPLVVSEADFLAPIAAGHPATATAGEALARAEAERRRAGTLANPRVEYRREEPDPSARQTTWAVAWAPPLDGRRGVAVRAAEAGVGAARQRLTADILRVRAEARAAFAEWSTALRRTALLREHAALLERLAEQARARSEAGEESVLSRRRLELAAADARAAQRLGEAEAVRAEARARSWRPDLALEATPAAPPLPQAPADARPSLPEVEALRFEVERARLEERLAGRFWGFPELQGGWQRVGTGSAASTGPVLAASLSVPLFDRNQAARQEARSRRELTAARLGLAEQRAAATLAGARAAYATLRGATEEAGRAAEATGRVVESVLAAYRAGEASLTDLLETTRAALGARVQETDVRAAALAAHRELELALGRPLSEGAR